MPRLYLQPTRLCSALNGTDCRDTVSAARAYNILFPHDLRGATIILVVEPADITEPHYRYCTAPDDRVTTDSLIHILFFRTAHHSRLRL